MILFIFEKNIVLAYIYLIYSFFKIDKDKRLWLLFFDLLLKQYCICRCNGNIGGYISYDINGWADYNTSRKKANIDL